LVEVACYAPAINATVFPSQTSTLVWASSPYANYADYAWYVNFGSGSSGSSNRYGSSAVRLVRGGQ